jgi:hypothetical protein
MLTKDEAWRIAASAFAIQTAKPPAIWETDGFALSPRNGAMQAQTSKAHREGSSNRG